MVYDYSDDEGYPKYPNPKPLHCPTCLKLLAKIKELEEKVEKQK